MKREYICIFLSFLLIVSNIFPVQVFGASLGTITSGAYTLPEDEEEGYTEEGEGEGEQEDEGEGEGEGEGGSGEGDGEEEPAEPNLDEEDEPTEPDPDDEDGSAEPNPDEEDNEPTEPNPDGSDGEDEPTETNPDEDDFSYFMGYHLNPVIGDTVSGSSISITQDSIELLRGLSNPMMDYSQIPVYIEFQDGEEFMDDWELVIGLEDNSIEGFYYEYIKSNDIGLSRLWNINISCEGDTGSTTLKIYAINHSLKEATYVGTVLVEAKASENYYARIRTIDSVTGAPVPNLGLDINGFAYTTKNVIEDVVKVASTVTEVAVTYNDYRTILSIEVSDSSDGNPYIKDVMIIAAPSEFIEIEFLFYQYGQETNTEESFKITMDDFEYIVKSGDKISLPAYLSYSIEPVSSSGTFVLDDVIRVASESSVSIEIFHKPANWDGQFHTLQVDLVYKDNSDLNSLTLQEIDTVYTYDGYVRPISTNQTRVPSSAGILESTIGEITLSNDLEYSITIPKFFTGGYSYTVHNNYGTVEECVLTFSNGSETFNLNVDSSGVIQELLSNDFVLIPEGLDLTGITLLGYSQLNLNFDTIYSDLKYGSKIVYLPLDEYELSLSAVEKFSQELLISEVITIPYGSIQLSDIWLYKQQENPTWLFNFEDYEQPLLINSNKEIIIEVSVPRGFSITSSIEIDATINGELVTLPYSGETYSNYIELSVDYDESKEISYQGGILPSGESVDIYLLNDFTESTLIPLDVTSFWEVIPLLYVNDEELPRENINFKVNEEVGTRFLLIDGIYTVQLVDDMSNEFIDITELDEYLVVDGESISPIFRIFSKKQVDISFEYSLDYSNYDDIVDINELVEYEIVEENLLPIDKDSNIPYGNYKVHILNFEEFYNCPEYIDFYHSSEKTSIGLTLATKVKITLLNARTGLPISGFNVQLNGVGIKSSDEEGIVLWENGLSPQEESEITLLDEFISMVSDVSNLKIDLTTSNYQEIILELYTEESGTIYTIDSLREVRIEGAAVSIFNQSDEEVFSGITDASGLLPVKELPIGEYKVYISHEYYQEVQEVSLILESTPIVHEIQMEPKRGSISIDILADKGNPLLTATLVDSFGIELEVYLSELTEIQELPFGSYTLKSKVGTLSEGYEEIDWSREFTVNTEEGIVLEPVTYKAVGVVIINFVSIFTGTVIPNNTFTINGIEYSSGEEIKLYLDEYKVENLNLIMDWQLLDSEVKFTISEPNERMTLDINVFRPVKVTLYFTDSFTGQALSSGIEFLAEIESCITNEEGKIEFYPKDTETELTLSNDPTILYNTSFLEYVRHGDLDVVESINVERSKASQTISIIETLDKQPIEGMEVTINFEDGSSLTRTTNSEGLVTLSESFFGRMIVSLQSSSQYESIGIQSYDFRGQDVTYELYAKGFTKIYVRDELTNDNISGTSLKIIDKSSGEIMQVTTASDSSGKITTKDLPSGEYEVYMNSPSSLYLHTDSLLGEFRINKPSDNGTVIVKIKKGSILNIQFQDGTDSTFIASGTVSFSLYKNGEYYKFYTTDSNKFISIDTLEYTLYEIRVSSVNTTYYSIPEYKEITLTEGENNLIINLPRRTGTMNLEFVDSVSSLITLPDINVELKYRTRSDGPVVDTFNFTSDSSGRIYLEEILFGIYDVTISGEPSDYILISEVNPIEIKSSATYVTMQYLYEKMPMVGIVVKDEITGLPIEGVVLEIRRAPATWQKLTSSDAEGDVSLSGFRQGNYQIRMSSDSTYKYFTNYSLILRTISISNKDEIYEVIVPRTTGQLRLKAEFGEAPIEPIESMQFKVTLLNDTSRGTLTTNSLGLVTFTNLPYGKYLIDEVYFPDNVYPMKLNKVIELTADTTGTTHILKYEHFKGLDIAVYDSLTMTPVSNLPFSTYEIPSSAKIYTTSEDNVVRPDLEYDDPTKLIDKMVTDSKGKANSRNTDKRKVALFYDFTPESMFIWKLGYNTYDTGQNLTTQAVLLTRRINSARLKIVDNKGNPLVGIEFKIWIDEDIINSIKPGDLNSKGEPYTQSQINSSIYCSTVQSNGSGIIEFPNLPYGKYRIEEVSVTPDVSPRNYEGSIVVDYRNEDKDYVNAEIKYSRTSSLAVSLIDNIDNSIQIAGVVFELKNTAGELVTDYTILSNGAKRFNRLADGNYTLTIKNIPPEYGNGVNPYVITETINISGGSSTRVITATRNTVSIQVKSVSLMDGTPIAGSVFLLSAATGSRYYRATTDENGIATFTGIMQGEYILDQTSAPVPYIANTTRLPINLDTFKNPSWKPTGYVFECTRNVIITIKTFDALTGQAIQGYYQWSRPVGTSSIYATDAYGVLTLTDATAGTHVLRSVNISSYYEPAPPVPAEAASFTDSPHTEYKKTLIQNGNDLNWSVYLQRRKGKVVINVTNTKDYTAVAGVKYKISSPIPQLQAKLDNLPTTTFTTDSEGRLIIPNLTLGNYVITEVSVPAKIQSEGHVFNVHLSEANDYTYTLDISYKKLMPLVIYIHSPKSYTTLLDGAKFELLDNKGQVVYTHGMASRINVNLNSNALMEAQNAPIFDRVTNSLLIPNLRQEDYTLRVLDNKIGDLFIISSNNQLVGMGNDVKKIHIVAESPTAKIAINVYGFNSMPLDASGKAKPLTVADKAGAVKVGPSIFAIYRVVAGTAGAISVDQIIADLSSPPIADEYAYRKVLYSVMVTNSDGHAISAELEAGVYYIEEIEPPPGYQSSKDLVKPETMIVPILASEVSIDYPIQLAKGLLDIQVKDIVTGNKISSGVTFNIKGAEPSVTNVFNNVAPDSSGRIYLNGIQEGMYAISLNTNSNWSFNGPLIVSTLPAVLTKPAAPYMDIKLRPKSVASVNVLDAIQGFASNLLGLQTVYAASSYYYKVLDVEDLRYVQFSINKRDNVFTVWSDYESRSGFTHELRVSSLNEETRFQGLPYGRYQLELYKKDDREGKLIKSSVVLVEGNTIPFPSLAPEEIVGTGYKVSFREYTRAKSEIDTSAISEADMYYMRLSLSNIEDNPVAIEGIHIQVPLGYKINSDDLWVKESEEGVYSLNKSLVKEEGLSIGSNGELQIDIPIIKAPEEVDSSSLISSSLPKVNRVIVYDFDGDVDSPNKSMDNFLLEVERDITEVDTEYLKEIEDITTISTINKEEQEEPTTIIIPEKSVERILDEEYTESLIQGIPKEVELSYDNTKDKIIIDAYNEIVFNSTEEDKVDLMQIALEKNEAKHTASIKPSEKEITSTEHTKVVQFTSPNQYNTSPSTNKKTILYNSLVGGSIKSEVSTSIPIGNAVLVSYFLLVGIITSCTLVFLVYKGRKKEEESN